MTDIKLLQQLIDDSGMKKTAIAQKSDIDRTTLYNRMNGKGEFTASEIVGLTKTLKLSRDLRDRIFFAEEVDLKATM